MTIDSETLNVLAGGAATFVVTGLILFRQNRQTMQFFANTISATISSTLENGLKDIKQGWQTSSAMYQDSLKQQKDIYEKALQLKDDTVEILSQRVAILEKQQGDYKDLADTSISDRGHLQQQINEILQARSKTALDTDKKINDLTFLLQQKTADLDKAQAELTVIKKNQEDITAASKRITDLQTKLDNATTERDQLRIELTAQVNELQQRVKELEIRMEAMMKKNADLEAENAALEADKLRMKAQMDALQMSNDQLTAEKDHLEQRIQVLEAQLKLVQPLPTPDAPTATPTPISAGDGAK